MPNFKIKLLMKKRIILIISALLSLSVFTTNADEKPVKTVIPLNKIKDSQILNRSLTQQPIESCYIGMLNLVQTDIYRDLGEVFVEISNVSTGEISSDSFDSGLTPQHFLPISGNSGYYQVTYIIENGDIYEGLFIL